MDSTPRQTTAIFISQKPRKQAHNTQWHCGQSEGQRTQHGVDGIARRSRTGCQTSRRPPRRAGWREDWRRARQTGARMKTGNGMPYLAPAWALSSMGTRTMRLPSSTVPTACFQSMPLAMRTGGEHVGGDLHGHGEPERDVVVGAPGALLRRGGGARSAL